MKHRNGRAGGYIAILLALFCLPYFSLVTAAGKGIVSLENPSVKQFLTKVFYVDERYRVSCVLDYVGREKGRQDLPRPAKITFPRIKGKVWINLRLKGGKPAISWKEKEKGEDGKAYVYNLVPQSKYAYTVQDAGGRTIKSGVLYTGGTLRMCRVDGVRNVRDIGGWRTGDGRRIRYGKIYRGGELDGKHHVTEKGKQTMKKVLRIGVEVDLRKKKETKDRNRSVLGNKVAYYRYSTLSYRLPDRKKATYAKVFRRIFRSVEQEQPVYLHCVYGCDRTGTIAFLLEGLLGVNESDLAKEYELSSFYLPRTRDGAFSGYRELVQEIKTYPGDTLQDKITGYFHGLGFTDAQVKRFRDRMLTEAP
ncbi:MAG: tyrosine-protein phosphatase [Lachnospiraceae bacterium]|nr:tyrosine-protein phosphatase [Lachnospiraceae bacterium]